MDYGKDILNRLIDMYERRGAFDKDASSLRAIQIEVKKVYPAYVDRYNHDAYKEINVAIEKSTHSPMPKSPLYFSKIFKTFIFIFLK